MKKKWVVLFVAVLMIALAAAGCGQENQEPPEDNEQQQEWPEDDPPEKEPEPDEEIILQKVDPVSVIINNHTAAVPQSGLQQATVVYEFLVEGGITRFLAVYDTYFMDNFLIGPVRSLRPYFAETAMEHGAVIVYSGLSQRTAQLIAALDLRMIVSSQYLWRDNSRKAPHNLYTDVNHIYMARGASSIHKIEPEPRQLPEGEEALEIEITYSSIYSVSYSYDEEKDMYMRYRKGSSHNDRETGEQYGATRVIVRKNRHSDVAGTDLVDIELDGSGTAVLYEAGRKFDVTWEKTGDKTVYRFADGSEVNMQNGNTWVQVVR